MYHTIPEEIRLLPQWVCADRTKIPINPKTGKIANPIDPNTWATFEQAQTYAKQHSLYIGFVLSKFDPFSIIDLDNKPEKPCTPEQLERHQKILHAANSYTEYSISGTGFHIIVKGTIPSGTRKDNVEVYSDSRYMICTGRIIEGYPTLIQPRQEMLDILFREMQSDTRSSVLKEAGETIEDHEVVNMAMAAVNADKFNALCMGDQTGYPSQSEADFALLSIFAYYTQSNEQVRRLFRMATLGKRDKATKNDTYLNFALGKIRAKEPPLIDFEEFKNNIKPIPPKVSKEKTPQKTNFFHPPGLIGELQDYFYHTAIRPIPEVALMAAIAVTSGVCSRSFNISETGLNQYLVLLAKTGSGKEGAASGIDKLLYAVRNKVPMVGDFRGPAKFASGQSILRWLSTKPCFFSILGEFGLTLQQMNDGRSVGAHQMIKEVLLDIYAKSGWGRELHTMAYSDSEKNTAIVNAPNVTILGESTPEAFFDGMDAHQVAQGLIPRFSIIEYVGDRPAFNESANFPPSDNLVQRFSDLVAISLTATNSGNIIRVGMTAEVKRFMKEFDDHSNNNSNREDKSGVTSQMWTRAHLKVLKLAALIAVGINPHNPIIEMNAAEWAVDFVTRDINFVIDRFSEGDVGLGDSKQIFDLKNSINSYLNNPPKHVKENPQLKSLHKAGLIPYKFLAQKTVGIASYRNDRLGATQALKRNIQSLIDSGLLIELARQQVLEKFGFSGLVYGLTKQWEVSN